MLKGHVFGRFLIWFLARNSKVNLCGQCKIPPLEEGSGLSYSEVRDIVGPVLKGDVQQVVKSMVRVSTWTMNIDIPALCYFSMPKFKIFILLA